MNSRSFLVLLVVCPALLRAAQTSTSNSGTIRGTVVDPTGASVPGATVEIQNPVSHYARTVQTDAAGAFVISNVPFNNYHATAGAPGFESSQQDVNVRSSVPVDLQFKLALGTENTSVTVMAGTDLVETDPTTHTDVDRGLFDKLPLQTTSTSVSSLVTLATPGVTADSNGMFHGLGDHASNSFSVDGQQISDQQSKTFSNQIPLSSVQSMEVIEGAPPAEYGDKTSVVIEVTTRSGLGVDRPHADFTSSYGTFGTAKGAGDLQIGGPKWGNFISADGLETGRFLDAPEFEVFHDRGNEQNIFNRFDLKPTDADSLTLNLGFARSWFQTPNSYDAQYATGWPGGIGPNGLPVGSQDQRSRIMSFNVAPSWTHVAGAATVLTLAAFLRQDQYNYYPSDNPFADFSPGLQQQSIGQNRRLTNAGVRGTASYASSIHNAKFGFLYQQTFLTERDRLGIVDPTLNPVCLDAAGAPVTDPALTDAADCTQPLAPNPAFVPMLGCYDLTRTGALPPAAGCPGSVSGTYGFLGHTDVKELGLYVQDAITVNRWTFNLGIRGDIYNGLTSATQAEPRLGVAYSYKPTSTVLRASYARTLETPFNENLVLASVGCKDPVIYALETLTQGYPCLSAPLRPGTRNEFHLGLQQAFGRFLVIDGEYIWKYTNLAYDFSVLGYTPITFPIEWTKSKIPGYAIRASMPNNHGLSAFVVLSSVAARFFGPQVSGIGTTPSSEGGVTVFRIDHDEVFNQTTHIQYQPRKNMPWIGFNWRFDSGEVAGAVPCAGGSCANGPLGSDSVVDFSGLTADQQFAGGLFCGAARPTPFTPINSSGFCPASQFGSTLIRIPAPGTENDDLNPPRIAPRNLFDLAIGQDNLLKTDKYRLSAEVSVVNMANQVALYNFLSTFSGTHYVTPRTVTGSIGFHF